MPETFYPKSLDLTKYLFFTGKGGVGKTSAASALAVSLADQGRRIMLISTDPASNLQDVFASELDNKGVAIEAVPNLTVANFEPDEAAREYRESVIGPFRGKLPEAVLQNMEEQLSGSCTTEIASFNEFSGYITNKKAAGEYDHIIFDTAPTGHTLRMLELPSAWTDFIATNTTGASCLGQLSGLGDKKDMYKEAVDNLADGTKTTLILVTRPEESAIHEAARASRELKEIGVANQTLLINGVLESHDDELSEAIFAKQEKAMAELPPELKDLERFVIPLRPYNIAGLDSIRSLFTSSETVQPKETLITGDIPGLKQVVQDLYDSNKKIIFTMGKGGVGKTTMAAAIALGLAEKGRKVHLTTTDPAAHIGHVIDESFGITLSNIDEKKVLAEYREEILTKARENDVTQEDLDYIEEDLRSPCTQEIAVFRAFADIVDRSEDEVVVIDTAPTGHTLLLLESTENYDREMRRSSGETPESVTKLLPKLKDPALTEVIIIALAEATPYFEAKRLGEDLERAGIFSKWWIVNSSFHATSTTNAILRSKAASEVQWINEISRASGGNLALAQWTIEDLRGDNLHLLLV